MAIPGIAVLCIYVFFALLSTSAIAQSYPAKPLRIIVPWTAGGTADLLARTIAQKLSEGLGQTVIVENRPGVRGLIGTEVGAKAALEGYTLLLATTAPNSVHRFGIAMLIVSFAWAAWIVWRQREATHPLD